MDLVSPIFDVVKCIMIPTCNQVEHQRSLGKIMEDLRIKLEELKCKKEDIERRKQIEVCSDKEVTKEVEHWLGRAEAIVAEIQKVEEKFRNVSFMCRSCLSKRVQKRIEEVDKVLEKGKFPEGIVISKPPARGMILPTDQHAEGGRNNVKFREHLEEKILGYLMADDVGRVGVCGLGGVGKTTLAKSINNKMSNLQESKFDKVICALRRPNLEEISRVLVNECAGLPLAIVVIAKSMRTEGDISGWRNALNELRNRVKSVKGWDDEIFERLKFSYHRLKDEELQNCFLFCSLYGKEG